MTHGDSNTRKKVEQGGFFEPGRSILRKESHVWLKDKGRPGDMEYSPDGG